MIKDHSDSEKGNPLPPHRLLLSINSKGSFICTIPQTGLHIPVVEHWLEREIAQWVHPMKDRSDDPLHHEWTPLPEEQCHNAIRHLHAGVNKGDVAQHMGFVVPLLTDFRCVTTQEALVTYQGQIDREPPSRPKIDTSGWCTVGIDLGQHLPQLA